MYKSAVVHYQNKYPDAEVRASDSSVDVYGEDGHLVALRKNGAGQWVDVSEEMGCIDRHDMAPLPQNSCHRKLHRDGKIGLAEEHIERSRVNRMLADHPCGGKGKVPSCAELKAAGAKSGEAEPGVWSVSEAWLAESAGKASKPAK